jgi:polyhydroxyalkanoate synthesis regulator phasin
MSKRIKILVGAAAVVLLISAFFATLTFAADPTATPTPGTPQALAQEFMSKLASKLGIGQDKLQTAVKDSQNEIIDQLVQEGKITQQQADQLKQKVTANNGVIPFGGAFERGFMHGFKMGVTAADISSFLGITEQQLYTELQSGQTLAQVAQAHGKTADQLKTYIHDKIKASLDAAVKNGQITQAQEDTRLSTIDTQINAMINGQAGAGCFGGLGGKGRHGGMMRGNGMMWGNGVNGAGNTNNTSGGNSI